MTDPRDLTKLWQDQTTPGVSLSVEEMRRRAKRSMVKARRERFIGGAAVGVMGACAVLRLFFLDSRFWRLPLLVLQMIGLIVWVLHVPVSATGGNSILVLNLGSAPISCLEYYRKELEARRDRHKKALGLIPLFSVFLIAFTVFGAPYRPIVLPFGVLIVIVLLASYVRMRREAPRIKVEIEELDAFREG